MYKRQGVYRVESLKGVSESQLQRFFLRGKGANQGMARVRPELQAMIEFVMANLVQGDWPFRDPFDMVFC